MKRRTGLLFSTAVVLGLVGGAGAGFAVQRSRPATPLPPVPHTLAAAVAPGAAEKPDPKTDDGAKLDGDLRDLLVDKPADAYDDAALPALQWLTIGHEAEFFGHPDYMLAALNEEGFRRAARRVWDLRDGTTVEISLVQFRSTEGADDFVAQSSGGVADLTPIAAGTGTGYVNVDTSPGRNGYYNGLGLVQHGTVVEELFVLRKQSPPDLEYLKKITKEQADRL